MSRDRLTVFDNHIHLKNESLDFIISTFKNEGGTGLNLINLTEDCQNIECFVSEYERNIRLSKLLRDKGLDVIVTLGPYPVNIMRLREKLSFSDTYEIYEKATDEAIKAVNENHASAIGEVGRFHFPIDERLQEEANTILKMIAAKAHDFDIPLIIHSESLDENGMCELLAFLEKGVGKLKVVKHFSQPVFNLNCSIIPSVPASRKNARMAPWGKKGFFLETDFVGDYRKPNYVLPPDSVPKRIKMLLQEGVDPDDINKSMEFYKEFY